MGGAGVGCQSGPRPPLLGHPYPVDSSVPLIVDSIVPFAADGTVDLGAARAHALWLRANGVDGVAIAASELLHVDRKEKERLVEVVADVMRGLRVFVPVWDPSPAYALKLARVAADRGATDALLPAPLLVPLGEEALLDWFRSFATHVPVRAHAWSDPRFGNTVSPRLLGRLRAESAVAGWLDASGDVHRIRRLAEVWPDVGLVQLDGLSAADLAALAGAPGLAGGVSRLANAWPDLVRRTWVAREPGLAEALVRRGAAVERAGGIPALKHALRVGVRLPVAGVDVAEAEKLPTTGFQ